MVTASGKQPLQTCNVSALSKRLCLLRGCAVDCFAFLIGGDPGSGGRLRRARRGDMARIDASKFCDTARPMHSTLWPFRVPLTDLRGGFALGLDQLLQRGAARFIAREDRMPAAAGTGRAHRLGKRTPFEIARIVLFVADAARVIALLLLNRVKQRVADAATTTRRAAATLWPWHACAARPPSRRCRDRLAFPCATATGRNGHAPRGNAADARTADSAMSG